MRRKLRLDPAFALAVCYLLVGERSVWGLLSLAAALLHELGHLGAAALLGIRPAEITVGALGARMGFSVPLLSYRHELLIAAAGPGVNLVCIPPCLLGIHRLGGLDGAGEYLLFFAAASFALAAVNLLPLRTFDGGRILGALCALWFGDRVSRRVVGISSSLCSILLWGCGVALWFSAVENLSLLVLSTALLMRTVQDSLVRQLSCGYGRIRENSRGKRRKRGKNSNFRRLVAAYLKKSRNFANFVKKILHFVAISVTIMLT